MLRTNKTYEWFIITYTDIIYVSFITDLKLKLLSHIIDW